MTEPETASFESTNEGLPVNHRRGVPRHPALWDGTCSIERESTGPRGCRVIDISIFGLGITLKHPSPLQLCGAPYIRSDSYGRRLGQDLYGGHNHQRRTGSRRRRSSWSRVRWLLTESDAIIALCGTNVELQRECGFMGHRTVTRHDPQFASARKTAGATPPKP